MCVCVCVCVCVCIDIKVQCIGRHVWGGGRDLMVDLIKPTVLWF